MKTINLKEIMQLWDTMYAARDDAMHYRRLAEDGSIFAMQYQQRAEAAEQRRTEALNAYEANPAKQKIEAELEAAQKRCTVRTLDVPAILDALDHVGDKLGISKKAMDGVSVSVDLNAQNFPNAYKGIPESTQFTAIYKAGSWRLTDIRRAPTRRESLRYEIHHTEASKAALLARFTAFVS